MNNHKSTSAALVLSVPSKTALTRRKAPKPLPPVPVWTTRAMKLRRTGRRTVAALRESVIVKEMAGVAIGFCVKQILNPDGAVLMSLRKNKKWGALVTFMVTHQSYQQWVNGITDASIRLVEKGFAPQNTYTIPAEDIQVVPEVEAVAAPVDAVKPAGYAVSLSAGYTPISFSVKC